MRSYGVLPSQVTATGPKGFILKGDVLKIVRGSNLQLIDVKSISQTPEVVNTSKPAEKKAPAKQAKKPAAKASKEKNGDAADPMVQSWEDIQVEDDFKPVAQALHQTKRYSGLAYMSSKSEVSSIARDFPDIDFELFLIKAAQKAFTQVFEEGQVTAVKADSLTS